MTSKSTSPLSQGVLSASPRTKMIGAVAGVLLAIGVSIWAWTGVMIIEFAAQGAGPRMGHFMLGLYGLFFVLGGLAALVALLYRREKGEW